MMKQTLVETKNHEVTKQVQVVQVVVLPEQVPQVVQGEQKVDVPETDMVHLR